MCLAHGAVNYAECVKRASDISSSPAVNELKQYPIPPDSQAVSSDASAFGTVGTVPRCLASAYDRDRLQDRGEREFWWGEAPERS